jgi:TetR/AcrR family transcriptional regulator, cholesterol catabolism regulator
VELREHILTEADKLFCMYGIKSVTMDDIAKHLGMSKKTIYQYFCDKNQLVVTLIENRLRGEECQLVKNAGESENAVEEVWNAVSHIKEMFSKLNPVMFYDMQKYHPDAWAAFQKFRDQHLYNCIRRNLEKGRSETYYREDINIDIVATMRMEQIDVIFNPSKFPAGKFNLANVMIQLTEHYLYGICTLKGHKLINKYKQIIENE